MEMGPNCWPIDLFASGNALCLDEKAKMKVMKTIEEFVCRVSFVVCSLSVWFDEWEPGKISHSSKSNGKDVVQERKSTEKALFKREVGRETRRRNRKGK